MGIIPIIGCPNNIGTIPIIGCPNNIGTISMKGVKKYLYPRSKYLILYLTDHKKRLTYLTFLIY